MREDIRERLIQKAKANRLVTYKELGEQFQIRAWWRQLGRIVGEISIYEHEHKRPYLSAIVVRQDTQRPGNGFWGLTGIDTNRPWEYYRDQVWQYWSTH